MGVKALLRGTSCYSTQLLTRKAAVLGVRVKSREPSNTKTKQFIFSHNALLHGNSDSGRWIWPLIERSKFKFCSQSTTSERETSPHDESGGDSTVTQMSPPSTPPPPPQVR